MTSKPIVWSIAGSDSGGGAGIQADLHTMQDFGVHGCTAITALTAQNSLGVKAIDYCSKEVFKAQLDALQEDLPAAVIKLGMLGHSDIIEVLADFLKNYRGFVVCDPVFLTTTRAKLMENSAKSHYIEKILPFADLITPNLAEASVLTGKEIASLESIVEGAKQIAAMTGKAVLIKGGHGTNQFSHDYFLDQDRSYWITHQRLMNCNTHGTGCTLSSAIASCLACGYTLHDAIILARMYVHKGIRLGQPLGKGPGPVGHHGFPNDQADLPVVSATPLATLASTPFPQFDPKNGIYALIKNCSEMKHLLTLGISTFQLRIKDLPLSEIQNEIIAAIPLARNAGAQLFVNDYWEMAIAHHADGVHLGQEDLADADIEAIRSKGLQLGISTHNLHEIAIAHQYKPSYIGFGPIYPTKTKVVKEPPKGEEALATACRLLNYPVIAIGGISPDQLQPLQACGAAAIAMSSNAHLVHN